MADAWDHVWIFLGGVNERSGTEEDRWLTFAWERFGFNAQTWVWQRVASLSSNDTRLCHGQTWAAERRERSAYGIVKLWGRAVRSPHSPRGRLSTVGQIEKVADLVVHFPIGPCGQPPFERRGGDGPPGRSLPITRGSGRSPPPPRAGRDPRGQNALQNPAEFRPNFSDFLTPAVQRPGGVGGLRPLP